MATHPSPMQAIPTVVREYLSFADETGRLLLLQQHPGLEALLRAPETREVLLTWLSSEEAWDPPTSGFTASALQFLRAGATAEEGRVVRAFLLHVDSLVRLRAYEHLLTLYFPDKNREGMFLLLHGMLADADDRVRTAGVSYVERAGAVGELREFLERWQKTAASRGWQEAESFELVERLLKP